MRRLVLYHSKIRRRDCYVILILYLTVLLDVLIEHLSVYEVLNELSVLQVSFLDYNSGQLINLSQSKRWHAQQATQAASHCVSHDIAMHYITDLIRQSSHLRRWQLQPILIRNLLTCTKNASSCLLADQLRALQVANGPEIVAKIGTFICKATVLAACRAPSSDKVTL